MSSACLNAFCFLALFCLAESLGNVPEAALLAPLYITRRPEPIVRYSDDKAAQVNAQIMVPASARDHITVVSFHTAKSDGPLGWYPMYMYRPEDGMTKKEDYDDLHIQVEKEETQDFITFDFAIEAQITGEIQFSYGTLDRGYYERLMVEVLDEQQQFWAEHLNYRVGFFQGRPHDIGEEVVMRCKAWGPGLTTDDVSLAKDGEPIPASQLTYHQESRAKVTVVYQVDGYEEGEFECSVRDEATGAVTSKTTSVLRN